MDAAELQKAVAQVPRWWHSIDLGNGIVTPGIKTPAIHQQELASWRLMDLHGKTVLDVGAWDGYYAFEAERRGAKRVVAVDHYVWSVDWAKAMAYREHCEREGTVPPGVAPRRVCLATGRTSRQARFRSSSRRTRKPCRTGRR